MKHILALDQGTTGSTALIVSQAGRVVGRGYREIAQHFPAPGWVEHDPNELFTATRDAARDAIALAGVQPDCIGLTNQRETIVLWDRETGEPIAPAIVWQDRRTAARCAELAVHAPEIARLTGLVTDPYFSATKLEWLLAKREGAHADRSPQARSTRGWSGNSRAARYTRPTRRMRRARCCTTSRRASGRRGCVTCSGSRARSSRRCVRRQGPSASRRRALRPGASHTRRGRRPAGGAVRTGVRARRPGQEHVRHGCVPAAAHRRRAASPVAGNARDGRMRPAWRTRICARGEHLHCRCRRPVASGWARYREIGSRDGSDRAVAREQRRRLFRPGAHRPGCAALGAGRARHDRRAHARLGTCPPRAGGARSHGVRHGGCAGPRCASRARRPLGFMRVDGGAANNAWLMQFQADLLGVPVERPDSVETTALGAAALAGVAAGVWRDADDFVAPRRFTRFVPGAGATADAGPVMSARDGYAGWRRAVRARSRGRGTTHDVGDRRGVVASGAGHSAPRATDAWFGSTSGSTSRRAPSSRVSATASRRRGRDTRRRCATGPGRVIVIGLGRELYDWRTKGQFSTKDSRGTFSEAARQRSRCTQCADAAVRADARRYIPLPFPATCRIRRLTAARISSCAR